MQLPELNDFDARSPAVAAMINPALIAAVLSASAQQYASRSQEAMPWEYAFLIVPLVLHTPTREALPASTSTNLAKWVGDNKLPLAGLGARAKALSPYVREGLRFGLRYGLLELAGEGRIESEFAGSTKRVTLGDLKEIIRAAGLLGRWFALTDGSATVFKLLGVAP